MTVLISKINKLKKLLLKKTAKFCFFLRHVIFFEDFHTFLNQFIITFFEKFLLSM